MSKRATVDCESCGKTELDADDVVRYEGYLVCRHCRIVNADELSARRVREDEMYAEAASDWRRDT